MTYPLLALAAGAALLLATAPAPRSRTFRLTCRATVPTPPAGTRRLDLWLPVPHPDASQDVRELTVTATQGGGAAPAAVPYTVETDGYGNQVLHLRVVAAKAFKPGQTFSLDHLGRQLDQVPPAPIAPVTVSLAVLVTRREHRNLRATEAAAPAEAEAPDPQLARWLQPDRLVPLDAKITAQAQQVAAQAQARTPLAQARAIYEHVVSTVRYDKTGTGWGQGDIYYACDARHGNCTDFHALFIGYCRALGIPARFSIGLPLPAARGQGTVPGYHCWAEFYAPDAGWVPIDASEAAKDPTRRAYFFGAHDENRVELSQGRDLTLTPAQAGPPLNFFVFPYAEADGKPLDKVAQQYTYADVAP